MPTAPTATVQDFTNTFLGTVPDKGMPGSPDETNAQIFGVPLPGKSAPAATGNPGPGSADAASKQQAADMTKYGFTSRTPAPARVNPDTIGATGPNVFTDSSGKVKGSNPSDVADYNNQTAENSRKTANTNRLADIANYAQGLTDSINQKYASKIADDKDLIASQSARAAVLNSHTGNTGSGTGAAALNTVQDKGNKVIAADEAARNAEIGVALGKVDTLKADQIKADALLAANNLKAYGDARLTAAKTAGDTLSSLAKSGVDLATLKEKEPQAYATLQKGLNLSDMEMAAKYNASKQVPAKLQFKVTGDHVTMYGTDKDGKMTVEDQVVPGLSSGQWEITQTTDGRILQRNKTTGEYKTLGAGATHSSTTSTAPAASKADISGAIVWMRSQPDYKPAYETQFTKDPVAQAKVIEAWKAATKKTTAAPSNPYATP